MGGRNVLEVTNLHKSFKGRKIIENLNLSVSEGDIFGFLGPNGAGKTTTIRIILNLIYPDSGEIKLNGFDLKTNFSKAIEKVGAIVEVPKFYPYLSGYKNLQLMSNIIGDVSKNKIHEVLDVVGLSKRCKDKVKTYSLGMKQRLGIANALLNDPKLVILDEPTNGLDPQGMKEIRDLISTLASTKNITFFISTHLLHEVEQICNKVAILNQGEIIAQGEVQDLMNINYEVVEIVSPSSKEVINTIKDLDYVKKIDKSNKGVILHIEKEYSIELNRYLVSNNVDVRYIIPKNQSLESFFIKLISGGKSNV